MYSEKSDLKTNLALFDAVLFCEELASFESDEWTVGLLEAEEASKAAETRVKALAAKALCLSSIDLEDESLELTFCELALFSKSEVFDIFEEEIEKIAKADLVWQDWE